MSAKEQYEVLLEMGDLLIMFPGFTGEWEKDEKIFTSFYEANSKILDNENN